MKYAHTEAINPSDAVAIVDVAAAECEPDNDQVRSAGWCFDDAGEPGSLSWRYLPWESDPYAQTIVRVYDHGMVYSEISEWTGWTVTRIKQIEAQAIRKLQRAVQRGEITREDLEEMTRHWRTMNGEAVE